jgi:hypothetical protein
MDVQEDVGENGRDQDNRHGGELALLGFVAIDTFFTGSTSTGRSDRLRRAVRPGRVVRPPVWGRLDRFAGINRR